jgi:DNA polymerase III alpha subunit
VVATNDAHFLKESDHDAHDVLLCIGIGKDVKDQDRMHYDRGLYFKTRAEMGQRFADRADVLDNTLAIADEVDVVFGKKYHVPSFPLPPGVATENDLLVKLAAEGALARYAGRRGAAPGALAPRCGSGSTTSSASSSRPATRATSSSSPTSSRRRATAASRWARDAARRRARSWRLR